MADISYKRLINIPEKPGSGTIVYASYDDFINSECPEYFVNHISCQYPLERNVYISSIGHDRSWPGRIISFETNKDVMRLHYITEGEVRFSNRIVRAGEFFFTTGQNPAEELRFIDENAELYYIILKGKGLAEFIIHNCFYKTQTDSFAPVMTAVKKLFDDMIYGRHDDLDMTLYIYGGVYQILAYQKYINIQLGASEHKTTKPLAIQAMRIISEDYAGKLSVSDVAGQLNVCPDNLSRILRVELGYSAQTIITKKRMQLAQNLLTEKPYQKLSDIAQLCGYDDYVFFCKQFRKHNHTSPSGYRAAAMAYPHTEKEVGAQNEPDQNSLKQPR